MFTLLFLISQSKCFNICKNTFASMHLLRMVLRDEHTIHTVVWRDGEREIVHNKKKGHVFKGLANRESWGISKTNICFDVRLLF